MSRYGFLKLAVIRSPDFDEFISSCDDKISMQSVLFTAVFLQNDIALIMYMKDILKYNLH